MMEYKVYIYGAGKLGLQCLDFLNNSGIKVTGFLVSEKSDNPESIKNCSVLEYGETHIDKDRDLIVIALKASFKNEVLPILKKDGIRHIQFYPNTQNDSKSNALSLKVLIFGTGKYSLENRAFFYEDEIIGYLDNNKSLQNLIIDNKKVFDPQKINDISFDYVCILSSRYAVEMTLQLLELGVQKEKIISLSAFREKFYRSVMVRLVLDCPKPDIFPLIKILPKIDKYRKINFLIQKEPIVSIIIPVYNQFEYTYNCLRSISERTGNEIPYELIIADDCSKDQTMDMEKVAIGITVIHNKKNLRFLKNCNNAARYARGRYILFLNNDTQVQNDWLKSLVNLIESDDEIGMVGSKLLYPDGSLQEAGGIVWKDASAWNYGNRKNPSLPEFNYVKEVDYISGASIMIRKSLWNMIGGFDERFCPAYCEDSDLAFEVRKHGSKVMYQPASVVVHFEGKSN